MKPSAKSLVLTTEATLMSDPFQQQFRLEVQIPNIMFDPYPWDQGFHSNRQGLKKCIENKL